LNCYSKNKIMSNFQKLIDSEIPVLIDFAAEWCGPCKTLAPILKQVAKATKGKARIIKIDVDKNPEIAAQLSVRGVPTMIIYKNGIQLWRQSGVLQANQIVGILEGFM